MVVEAVQIVEVEVVVGGSVDAVLRVLLRCELRGLRSRRG